ncbi:hypothetical protein [Pantoea stewartii]|uniref:hypothetical protein n=1 Tax=Pantoea stewartii TaxID=66269 RepID=UPI00197D9A82|nr:hypothetical protein [Pantoea stewartii]
MISDEDLRRIAEDDYVQCGDASAMAKELLAYRKAFSEPVVWIDPQLVINFQYGDKIKEWAWSKKIEDTDIPLYRKPTTPE